MGLGFHIAGVVLIVFVCVWFLQEISVLPGSSMTGQIRWAICGGIAAAVGIGLLVVALRKSRSHQSSEMELTF